MDKCKPVTANGTDQEQMPSWLVSEIDFVKFPNENDQVKISSENDQGLCISPVIWMEMIVTGNRFWTSKNMHTIVNKTLVKSG